MLGVFQLVYLTLFFAPVALGQKNGDEGRPYEFGFTIDGQQHRHEKKDERGIVQGEFGFITADGIYHVTVYATDENGKFKILSMRNLRISAPLDGSAFRGEISPEADKYRKQANLPPLPPAQPSPNALSVPQVVTTPRALIQFTTQPTIKPACAGCGYITTKKPVPGQSNFQFQTNQNQISHQQPFGSQNNKEPIPVQYDNTALPAPAVVQPGIGEQQPNDNNVGSSLPASSGGQQSIQGGHQLNQVAPQNVAPESPPNYVGGISGRPIQSGGAPHQYQPAGGPQNTNYKSVGGSLGTQFPAGGGDQNQIVDGSGGVGLNTFGASGLGGRDGGANNKVEGDGANYPSTDNRGQGIRPAGGGSDGLVQGNFPVSNQQPSSDAANPLQIPGQGPPTGVSTLPPISISDKVIHVGGDRQQDIPIRDKFPGMQEGLPNGIEETDITNLLYKFHYTVGFHGHYEKGLKNGAKIGGYFVNGRDGISRVVTYIADENGYRPKVKFINLGLESEETPKAETEKSFGLKSFEFVWYPI